MSCVWKEQDLRTSQDRGETHNPKKVGIGEREVHEFCCSSVMVEISQRYWTSLKISRALAKLCKNLTDNLFSNYFPQATSWFILYWCNRKFYLRPIEQNFIDLPLQVVLHQGLCVQTNRAGKMRDREVSKRLN